MVTYSYVFSQNTYKAESDSRKLPEHVESNPVASAAFAHQNSSFCGANSYYHNI